MDNVTTEDNSIIYTFNARDDIRYPLMKQYFNLSDEAIYNTIQSQFNILKQRLKSKGIVYDNLKGALLPNQEDGKLEICFIIDTNQIENNYYGSYVFNELLPLLDKNSVCSVLSGDYVDFLFNEDKPTDSQHILKQAMAKVIKRCNKSEYRHSSQYFLIYFNRLTRSQFLRIVEPMMKFPWFTGYADVSHQSVFKTNLSFILSRPFIKFKDKILLSHPVDYPDDKNFNMFDYPFEESGYKVLSINEDSFASFLSYKIESHVPDETDISFSFNAIFPKFDSVNKLTLKIDDKKWDEYLTKDDGKGGIIKLLGYNASDKEKFIREIYKKICSNYVYKLERKKVEGKNFWKFCVCIDMFTINSTLRKTTVVLNYFPDVGEMKVITVT